MVCPPVHWLHRPLALKEGCRLKASLVGRRLLAPILRLSLSGRKSLLPAVAKGSKRKSSLLAQALDEVFCR